MAIPDRVGINDDGGTMLALVEASRHVGAHAFLQSAQGQFLLELKLQLSLRLGIAAAARMARITLVAADEQMPFRIWAWRQCTAGDRGQVTGLRSQDSG